MPDLLTASILRYINIFIRDYYVATSWLKKLPTSISLAAALRSSTASMASTSPRWITWARSCCHRSTSARSAFGFWTLEQQEVSRFQDSSVLFTAQENTSCLLEAGLYMDDMLMQSGQAAGSKTCGKRKGPATNMSARISRLPSSRSQPIRKMTKASRISCKT